MGVHTHTMAFMRTQWVLRGCSILTHWHSCTLNGWSGAVPTHSLVGMHTQWVFRGCSNSLIGVHMHSQVFRRWSILVQLVHVPEGQMNMFSNLQSAQRPYEYVLIYLKHTKAVKICSQFPFNSISLALPNKKSEKSWCHTWIDVW